VAIDCILAILDSDQIAKRHFKKVVFVSDGANHFRCAEMMNFHATEMLRRFQSEVLVQFLVEGHSKSDVDRHFSVIASHYNSAASTPNNCCTSIDAYADLLRAASVRNHIDPDRSASNRLGSCYQNDILVIDCSPRTSNISKISIKDHKLSYSFRIQQHDEEPVIECSLTYRHPFQPTEFKEETLERPKPKKKPTKSNPVDRNSPEVKKKLGRIIRANMLRRKQKDEEYKRSLQKLLLEGQDERNKLPAKIRQKRRKTYMRNKLKAASK